MKHFYKYLFAIGALIQITLDYINISSNIKTIFYILGFIAITIALLKSDIKKPWKEILVGLNIFSLILHVIL